MQNLLHRSIVKTGYLCYLVIVLKHGGFDLGFLELFLLSIGLAMDTFAVGICIGLTFKKITIRKALTVGLYFGIFQAVMPVIGFFAATLFAERITDFSSWIAFGLLCFIGGKMIFDGLKKGDRLNDSEDEQSLKFIKMLPLAIATSIDALAVGVSFAFLEVNLLPAVTLIGVTTLVLSIVGLRIGNLFGLKFRSKAQVLGGVILVLIGTRVLIEHMITS